MAGLLEFNEVKSIIGERAKTSNKGDHGKGLLLAGSGGLSGAAVMAAAAALRAGIGNLKALVPASILPAFSVLPEAMVTGLKGAWDAPERKTLEAYLEVSTAVAAGPGMGSETGVFEAVKHALLTKKKSS